jgi:hypothetical protein
MMTVPESLSRFGLVPSDRDLATIRTILADQADCERHGRERVFDLALLSCVQLFSHGSVEDVLRIWDAKQSGFDLACYLDVQLLFGPGLEQTKLYLATRDETAARDALAYIESCERTGEFDDFSPAAYLENWKQYFAHSTPAATE